MMRSFATFCHINEYDHIGYEHLHRMLAISNPLNLWAPSGILVRSPQCRISPEQYIQYVQEGKIRILARETWLTDREYRDNLGWAPAHWDPFIDGEIKKIFEADRGKSPDEQHVVAVRPERGADLAAEDLDRDPALLTKWLKVVNSDSAAVYIPRGTLEAADRAAKRLSGAAADEARVRTVLRDAYNHGHAIVESGAEVPFLLQKPGQHFLKVLSGAHRSMAQPGTSFHRVKARTTGDLSAVGAELVMVLECLEKQNRPDLAAFIGSDGHDLLVRWFAALCQDVKYNKPENVEGMVLRAFRRDVENTNYSGGLELRKFGRSWSATLSIAAVILEMIVNMYGVATDWGEILPWIGMGVGAYEVGDGQLKKMGYVPTDFDGAQWPFLYCFGQKVTRRRQERLLGMIDTIEAARRR